MERADWLLVAVGNYMEPIQLQKTLFKFAEESNAPPQELYEFIPYNWGPCSMQIYRDLERLREDGLVEFQATGRGWNAYRRTRKGEEVAEQLRLQSDGELMRRLEDIRNWVATRSFKQLLHDVYKDYPEYAGRSLFSGN